MVCAYSQIDNFISMSNLKYDAIVNSGIEIVNRIEIPPELVPPDAQVGMWLTLDEFPSFFFSFPISKYLR